MATNDDVLQSNLKAQAAAQKAADLSFDAVRVFGAMKQVAATGQPGALCLIDTLDKAPVGDAATLRSNIGLSNGPDGRSAMGLGAGDEVTHKRISAQGVAASYMDLHKLEGDTSDYQVRFLCDADNHAKVFGGLEIPGLTVGGKPLGNLAFVSLAINGVGTVVQKTISDVLGKDLQPGRIAAAWQMNAWDGSKDNSYVAGTWMCTSLLATTANTWVCTFIKTGD